MDRQTLRDWVHRFNADGVVGLSSHWSAGRPPALNDAQMAELSPWCWKGRKRRGVDAAVFVDLWWAVSRVGYAASEAISGCRSAAQFQGSSVLSSFALVRPETTRSRTLVSHVIGSTPFNFAV